MWIVLAFCLCLQTWAEVGLSCPHMEFQSVQSCHWNSHLSISDEQETSGIMQAILLGTWLLTESSSRQAFSLTQVAGLVKFTLGFKTVFNYKLNTLFYRKYPFILTFWISPFSTRCLLGLEHTETYSAMSLLANMNINIILWFLIFQKLWYWLVTRTGC